MKKYESMTKEDFSEMVLEAVFEHLHSDGEYSPIMSSEQEEEVGYEISIYESRIKLYPEENRTVTIRILVEEDIHD